MSFLFYITTQDVFCKQLHCVVPSKSMLYRLETGTTCKKSNWCKADPPEKSSSLIFFWSSISEANFLDVKFLLWNVYRPICLLFL